MDLNILKTIVTSGPTPLFATISGAHLYGFESPDSDVELRGSFVLALNDVLRLKKSDETLTLSEVHNQVEIDWVAHDIHKFARMMTHRNGYVLEQLYSPLIVIGGEFLDELREIGQGCIIRHLYHHYRGFAHRQFKLLNVPIPTIKDLLYSYRVLLTGIHVLQTGEIEANLIKLNDRFKLPGVNDLIVQKSSGTESGGLSANELKTHLPQLSALETRMEEAFDKSCLPDEPTTYPALDDFIVRIRLELGRHERH
jgi:hypothetical protein